MEKPLQATEAQHLILHSVIALGVETVQLDQSVGRVLAQEIHANRDLPPYDVSAMDGFALRSADLAGVPVVLEIIEDIKAGDLPGKTLQTGQCARIMTGAPVPVGADAVIRVEETQEAGATAVRINKAVKPGNDIRLRGENMKDGDVV
ncbi:MAG: molybdenum cofactor biosynthesis protein, partial [Gallionellales bacterium CG_4_10_14_3_um_filter_54_96]